MGQADGFGGRAPLFAGAEAFQVEVDDRRGVEGDPALLEDLLERARVVVGVAVREHHAVDQLGRDALRRHVSDGDGKMGEA